MIQYIDDCDEVLNPGDHVAFSRGLYTHHCIYIGDGWVIHFASDGITKDLFDDIVGSNAFWVIEHDNGYSPRKIVKRAKKKLYGNDKYNLVSNNCEHFCEWCCTGYAWSHQVFGTLGMGVLFGPLGHVLGQISNDGGNQKYKLRNG